MTQTQSLDELAAGALLGLTRLKSVTCTDVGTGTRATSVVKEFHHQGERFRLTLDRLPTDHEEPE